MRVMVDLLISGIYNTDFRWPSFKTLGFPLLFDVGILKYFYQLQNFRIPHVILYRAFKVFLASSKV